MGYLTRSRRVMVLAVLAAFMYVVGSALAVAAYAILRPESFGTSQGLEHGADWLRFSAAVVATVAVCVGGWELVLQRRAGEAAEVGVGAVGTLLIAVGGLVRAASPRSYVAADVLLAIGVGVWGLLVLSRAARRSLEEHEQVPGRPAQAPLWLGAAGGLLILAIGSGLPTSIDNRGLSVASGALEAVGIGIFAGALAIARSDRLLPTRPVPTVLVGLWVLTGAFLTGAIVAGVVFGSDFSFTGIRVGVSLATAFELAGVAILGYAAWVRVGELVRPRPHDAVPAPHGPVPTAEQPVGPYPGAPPPPPGAPDPTVPFRFPPEAGPSRPCPACSSPVDATARFCSQCGTPLH